MSSTKSYSTSVVMSTSRRKILFRKQNASPFLSIITTSFHFPCTHWGTNHLMFVGGVEENGKTNFSSTLRKKMFSFTEENVFCQGSGEQLIYMYLLIIWKTIFSSSLNIEKKLFALVIKFRKNCHLLHFLHPSPQKSNGSSLIYALL